MPKWARSTCHNQLSDDITEETDDEWYERREELVNDKLVEVEEAFADRLSALLRLAP